MLSPKFMVDVWVADLLPEKKICCAASATFSRPSPRKSVAAYAKSGGTLLSLVPRPEVGIKRRRDGFRAVPVGHVRGRESKVRRDGVSRP